MRTTSLHSSRIILCACGTLIQRVGIHMGTCALQGHEFGLRWFTPTCEVPLCGHGTMAAAAAVGSTNANPVLTFHTESGELVVRCTDGVIAMDLPHNAPADDDARMHADLIKMVVGQLGVHTVRYSVTTKKLLVQLHDSVSRDELEGLRPDTVAMSRAHDGSRVRGIIVTTSGAGKRGEYDFISRYFAPWNGIAEDPVTGSAHTVLGPHWASVLGRAELRARQCSARGGDHASRGRAATATARQLRPRLQLVACLSFALFLSHTLEVLADAAFKAV
eukprot:m.32005 g.32005  ORF g.32005 m.32005 type:complete len:276 (-) comp12386_c0_seq3:573-1400(-)